MDTSSLSLTCCPYLEVPCVGVESSSYRPLPHRIITIRHYVSTHPIHQVMRATAFIQRAYSHGRALTELLQKVVVDRPTQTTLDVLHEVSGGGNTPCNPFAHDAKISSPVSVCSPQRALTHKQNPPEMCCMEWIGGGRTPPEKPMWHVFLSVSWSKKFCCWTGWSGRIG